MDGQVTKFTGWLTTLFTTTADQLARETGFVRRQRGYSGAAFVQTLVLGWLADPKATLEDFGTRLGVSETAVHNRMTEQSVALMRGLLEKATAHVVSAKAVSTELTDRFAGVFIEDCTSITLPSSLRDLFPGCGGGQNGEGAAGVKALLRFEALSGALSAFEWDRQSESDLTLSRRAGGIPKGALYLADLGFFCLKRLRGFNKQGIHWITRLHASAVASIDGRQPAEIARLLQKCREDRLDKSVLLGTEQLPARLVAVRCPPKIAVEKKRRLRRAASRKGRQVSRRQLVFCEWLVLATNLAAEEFSVEELWVLYRVRWQIELVFKRWKSLLGVATSNARRHPHRRLTELYAKLLGCLVAHWGMLLRAGLTTQYRLHSILKQVRASAGELRSCLAAASRAGVRETIRQLVDRLNRLKPRARRKAKPGTMELLLNPELAFK